MQRYLVVVEKAAGNYSAYCPDLPGCVATGATPEETRHRMHDAVELHLAGLKEDHLPIPEPSSFAEVIEVSS
jgi:predicted RNase H-like HicB family nuclease